MPIRWKAVGSIIQVFYILADFLFTCSVHYWEVKLWKPPSIIVDLSMSPFSFYLFFCFVYFEDVFSGAYTFRVVISLEKFDLFIIMWSTVFISGNISYFDVCFAWYWYSHSSFLLINDLYVFFPTPPLSV